MSDTPPIQRQLLLLRQLSARRRGALVEELAREYGVSLKTIRRDLDRLRAVGFPLCESTEQHGRKRWTLTGDSLTGSALSYDEAFAVLLAIGGLGSLHSTPIGVAAQSALQKLRSGLSDLALRYCQRLGRSIAMLHARQVDYSDRAEIVEQLLLGHEDRLNVFIAYQSRRSTEPTSYGISPYALRSYRNALYAVGRSDIHPEIRTWKIDRISEATVTEVQFIQPNDFDADAYFAAGIGITTGQPQPIRVRLSAAAAGPVSESRWHASQQIERHRDGSATLTLQVAINEELVGWLLSFGRDAQVLAPPELIARIQTELTAMLATYASSEVRP